MKYAIFIYQLLSYTTGFAGLVIAIIIYLKFKTKILKYYIYWLLIFTLTLILYNLDYFHINFLNKNNIYYNNIFFLFLFFLLAGLQFYIFPRLLHLLCNVEFKLLKQIIFILLLLFPLGLFCYPIIVTNNNIERISLYILCFKTITITNLMIQLYIILFLIVNIKKIKIKENRILAKITLITIIISFPIWILEYFWNYNFNNSPRPITTLNLQYFIWNLLCIIIVSKYLFFIPYTSLVIISESFINKYNISQREKQIIDLIIKGHANKEIAYDLKISNITVRNHIHNIYEKTKVQSKIELLNLINNEKVLDRSS